MTLPNNTANALGKDFKKSGLNSALPFSGTAEAVPGSCLANLVFRSWFHSADKMNPDIFVFMAPFGKFLIVLGAILAGIGVIVILLPRTNLPLGRLPGDFLYRSKHTTVYFPLATSLLLSVVLSLVVYLINHFRR